jgi:ligand-binding sensor domain-containing protein/two-component sensor histidine kinase
MFARLTILFFFCLLQYFSIAQAPYLYFSRLTAENGLSHNKVNCILQDKRGFIWVGTDDGLNRYDGRYFTHFRNVPGDVSTISGNLITDLLEDEKGILWIATADGGLTKYDYRLPPSQQFKQYKHLPNDSSSIPVNIVNCLLEDKNGYLWLGTSTRAVLRFDKRTEKFVRTIIKGPRNILDLCLDTDDTLWVGRVGGGIVKVNTKDMSYTVDPRYSDLYDTKLPHTVVSALYRDRDNDIWYGSWDKVLYRFNAATQQEEVWRGNGDPQSFSNDDIQGFAEDASGKIWMAGKYNGLTVLDKKEKKFFNYRYDPAREGTIAGNKVNCVFIDRSGLVWLGTDKGISFCNPAQHSFVQTFLPSMQRDITIYDFFKDDQGDLWIGTSEGIFMQPSGGRSFVHKPLQYEGRKLTVSKFFRDSDGTFYIGTDFSLFIYDPATGALKLLPNTQQDRVIYNIIESRIVSIVRDEIEGHPVLIAAPYGHFLVYYDFTDQKWVSRNDTVKKILDKFPLRDNLIRKIYKDPGGDIWLATAKLGLGEWRKGNFPKIDYLETNPFNKKAISNDNIYDIISDAKGNLWITTYGGGLNYFDKSTRSFQHIEGANNLLEGMQTDEQGNLWMISNGHLHKYDLRLKNFSSFRLPDLEKSGGVRGSIYKDQAGNMYVGGTNYFIEFHPGIINTVRGEPKVYFTDFKIFNNSYSDLLHQKKIRLQHTQNYFTIEFSAPEFSSGQISYSYMLEGFDKDWVEVGDRNFASYSNLDGRDYVFKVRATNKKGNWSQEYAALSIRIIPPFWKRWWFYGICAAVIAGTIYGLYRYRINELLKRQAIRNKIAQDLHDSVGSTLSSISVYSQVAKIYNEQKKSTDLTNTLEKISAASGEMISEMSDTVWAINPRNDNMDTMLGRMESFARPLLASQEIRFHFSYDPGIKQLSLEMTKRKNFYLIFKEAVNNALKYSGCRNLWVSIKHRNGQLYLIVQDDGKGFDTAKVEKTQSMSGNGMQNMSMRAKEMKGDCSVTSAPGKGTSIALHFPIP